MITDEDPFIPYVFSCNVPCKGDGCFVAWQCRSYLTLDVFYPVVTSYKVMAYQLGDSRISFNLKFELEGKSNKFKINSLVRENKLNDNSIVSKVYYKSKFNNKLVAFLVNHEGKILKAVNNEAFFVKDLNDLEPIFPFKCNKIPFGKFIDHCVWDKESISFVKYDHVNDLYRAMLQELGHVNHLNSHYLQLEILNRTIFSDSFEFYNGNKKESREGKYIEYSTIVKELGNIDGYVDLDIVVNREIVTQNFKKEKKLLRDIQIKAKCNLVYNLIEGSRVEIEFTKFVPEVFVSLEWCVLTCQHSPEKQIDHTLILPFTISSKIFTLYINFRLGSSTEKKN